MKFETTKENLKFIGILVNLFFPGLGNIMNGQKVFGVVVFITSSLLTCFYFLPVLVLASGEIERGSSGVVPLLISIISAIIAFIIDTILVVASVLRLARASN